MPDFTPEQLQTYWNMAVDLTLTYVPRLLLALVVLLIGLWLIGRILKVMDKALDSAGMDTSLASFLHSLAGMGLKVLLIISVASMIGIATTSFVAVLGAAGLAIGLALQGSLANFAGGVLILLFKPYRVGDFIEAQGISGTVREIQIFSTLVHTPDNKVIVVPNGALSNNVITNYSKEPKRRADFLFGISYDDDIGLAKGLIKELIEADNRIDEDPEPLIVVSELADNAVNITVRVWVDASDLSSVRYDLLEAVKHRFDQHGVNFPFPQRTVHLVRDSAPPASTNT